MTGKGSYHGQLPNTRDLNNLNTKLGNKNQKIYCNRFLKHVILDFFLADMKIIWAENEKSQIYNYIKLLYTIQVSQK